MRQRFDENLLLTNTRFIKQKEYWLNKLTGDIAETKLLFGDESNRRSQKDDAKTDIYFPGHLCCDVVKLGKQSDITIYIILLAGLVSLVYRYTGNEDITVISPLYMEYTSIETMNRFVFIRECVKRDTTLKELLLQCKQSVIDAYENQDYPYKRLVELLFEGFSNQEDRCISNVICTLKNLHSDKELQEEKDKLVFFFNREGNKINGHISYAPGIYSGYFVEQISNHFVTLLENAIQCIDGRISRIPFLSEKETKQLIFDFNRTDMTYSDDNVVHRLFEEQVKRTPVNVAAAYGNQQLTYGGLNEKANQLARVLRRKGIKQDSIVGIMMERNLDMIVSIMGVLKSGGAYLPIDELFPEERVKYIIKDSNIDIVLTNQDLKDKPELAGTALNINCQNIFKIEKASSPLESSTSPENLAYVIYTSGSTGHPKGAVVEHRNVVGYINAFLQEFKLTADDTIMQQASSSFDAFVEEVFPILTSGGKIAIPKRHEIIDMDLLSAFVSKNNVTLISCTPLLLNELNNLESLNSLNCITTLISGGDELKTEHVDNIVKSKKVYNTYGPTETTVCITYHKISNLSLSKARIPIGKPISNYKVYILDKSKHLVPIGVPGEICAAGVGITRGYLNRPELTGKKFIRSPFGEGLLYKTGDLGKWLLDGNIEFLGRIDLQVKVRGYRIELDEIEKKLVKHERIKEVVVLIKEDETGDKFLCAYYTASAEISISELRKLLARELPEYMIPSYFIQLGKLPLTSGGKLDRRALPAPIAQSEAVFVAPRNRIEEKLVSLWVKVLGIKENRVGIDDNFFELGGHSLKATVLASEIHKEFNVKVPLKAIFNTPTVREFAGYISNGTKDRFSPIGRVEKKEFYALSPAQKRLFILQQVELDNTAYNMPAIIPLPTGIDIKKLEETFIKLIIRHESLRTSFHMPDNQPVQKIHDELDFKIDYYEFDGKPETTGKPLPEDIAVRRSGLEHFIRPFDLSKAPLLRVGLTRTKDAKDLLAVDMHHIISDGISQGVLSQDFLALYQGEELPPLRIQYKDFSEWQNHELGSETVKQQEVYWLREFSGEIPLLDLPTDYVRPAIQSFEGDTIHFELSQQTTRKLKEMVLRTSTTLYMLLLAVYNVLLSKISNQEDIVIGTPVAGRRHADLEKVIGMFVNTLALRNFPCGEKTFTSFLQEVKERTLTAFDNQEYQFEELVEKVMVNRDASRNPLFDVMFVVENLDNNPAARIKNETVEQPAQTSSAVDYEDIVQVAKFDLSLTALDTGRTLIFWFQYCAKLFKEETVDRFVDYFKKIVSTIVKEPDKRLSRIEIISEEEKKRILYDFNNTKAAYPQDKTIHQLFEEQVERTPDHIAVVGLANVLDARHLAPLPVGHVSITYKELNEKSNRLAYLLMEKSVTPDTNLIVGIMIERSIEMIIGIMGILKAGGAYLPIDPEYPQERINYMSKDSNAKILLAAPAVQVKDESLDFIDISKQLPPSTLTSSKVSSTNLAYIIYTSGSTGKPKGVMVKHASAINTLSALQHRYPLWESDVYLLKTSYVFDVSVAELFGWFTGGGRLAVLEKGGEKDPQKILDTIEHDGITHVNFVPSMFNAFVEQLNSRNVGKLSGLKYIFLAGEALLPGLVNKFKRLNTQVVLENIYGPTEGTVYSSWYSLSQWSGRGRVPIGKPLQNVRLYILDKKDHLQLVGVPGELCVSGIGLSQGYLNQPELTAEKFFSFSFKTEHLRFNTRLYRTGDLARWLPDGNIEFLGRIDQQVKIRGFRIELGEIENQLLKNNEIKESVVLCKEDASREAPGDSGDKYLCAYIVGSRVDAAELRKYLSGTLPGYMIPSYFIFMDNIPLTPNGKIDRKALPEPNVEHVGEYTPPRNKLEEKLVEIWSGVLGIEKDIISIDNNFFELGGHSLKATILATKIHKEFNIRVPLTEIFKTPRIRGLSEYIKGLKEDREDRYASIEPVEKKKYYRLSSAQQRLFILQQLELNSTAYNMPYCIHLRDDVDSEKLEKTFMKLLGRHESLRTSFHMINEEPVQMIHDDAEFKIEYYDLATEYTETTEKRGEIQNSKFIIQNFFIRPFDLSQAPLLRVMLVEVEREAFPRILFLDMHHIITDGTSQIILQKEFMSLYSGETLAPLKLQYKDFSHWQNREEQQKLLIRQEQYWMSVFYDELPVLTLPIDYSRPLMQSFEGSTVYFVLSEQETRTLKDAAKQVNASLYMSILAVYTVLLYKLSGQEDIIVGSPIAARRHADLESIIGMFVNTLAIRNYLSNEKTFDQYLKEVKEHTLEAFENQEYQFENLIEKLSIRRDTSRNPIFDVMFNLMNQEDYTGENPEMDDQGEFEYIHHRGTSKFDLNLTAVDLETRLLLSIEYSTALFKPVTIERFIGYFRKILDLLSINTTMQLSEIEVITGEEKEQILNMSRGIQAAHDETQTIHRLFKDQVIRTPHHVAAVFHDIQMTYKELDARSSRLARVLIQKGVKPDSVVGLMAERSLEMLIGLLGIMKAGGAYLPIDMEYPEKRKMFMLEDSSVRLVLTNYDLENNRSYIPGDVDVIDVGNNDIYHSGDAAVLECINRDSDLLYVIYTSGSTGKPKGVMLEHRNLVNLMKFQFKYTNIDCSKVLQFTTISFDVSFQEIFSALLSGGTLYLIDEETRSNIPELFRLIARNEIKTLFLPMSFLRLVFSENDYIKLIPTCITHIPTAGEQVVISDNLRNYLRSRGIYLHNHYGPSEAHVVTTLTLAPDGEIPEIPSIGRPISNTSIYIVDKAKHLLPINVPGELYIGGIQVGRGYFGRNDLTRERFISSPFTPGERLYRTGDLAKWGADGNIEFLGRIDFQVKIRGFRVELGEIESQLSNYPGIKENVVTARSDNKGDKYICAYIVSDKEPETSELRKYLSKRLPDYMIPSYFVFLDEIPLTPNGKIDRRTLPAPELKEAEEYTAPRDAVEEKMVELWAELFGAAKERIGIDRNFFELGGQSLKAIGLIAKIHRVFDVKVPLAEVFKTPTIRRLAEYIRGATPYSFASIEPMEKKEYYPLSSAQKRMYILQQIDLNSTAYNMSQIIPLSEEVDIDKLEESFQKLIKRHDSLRTSFHMIGDQPLQKVHEDTAFKIEKYEESGVRRFVRAFDLSCAPLLRVGELKTVEGRNYLMVDMHHIISDGVSHQVLREDFMALYEGKKSLPLRIQYKDFAQWQNGELKKEKFKQQEKYWLKEFEDEIPVLELPTDFMRPAIQSFAGAGVRFEIPEEERTALKGLSLKAGTTLFMVLLGAVNVLLSRLSSQEDIIVGTPIAGRRHADLEKIIGMFVNTLALRNYPCGEQTFREFLNDIKKRTLEAFENQDYQFEELVDRAAVRRDAGRNPLFDVMFVVENLDEVSPARVKNETLEQPAQTSPVVDYEDIEQVAKFDLSLTALDTGRTLIFGFQYCTKLFKEETVDRFADYFKKIVSTIVKEPDKRLSPIEIISEEEKNRILYDFNNTKTAYPQGKTIHQLFEEQVERTPDHIAVVGMANVLDAGHLASLPVGHVSITYKELNEKSNRLVNLLMEKGVTPDTNPIVGIMVERSIEMIIGILSILKAGGAYLPIDPQYPQKRINYMLKDSGAEILLTSSDLSNCKLSMISSRAHLHQSSFITRHSDHLAYVIYTSGSTGKPKGVLVEHRNLTAYLFAFFREFNIQSTDTAIQLASYTFDAFIEEVFPILLKSGKLVIPGQSRLIDMDFLCWCIINHHVNIINCTPLLLNEFNKLCSTSSGYNPFKRVHTFISGGDALKRVYVDNLLNTATVYNTYGPTESTVCVTYYKCSASTATNIPIGKPVANYNIYILDKTHRLLPLGVPGELCVAGEGVTRGYLNNPELTAEKFDHDLWNFQDYHDEKNSLFRCTGKNHHSPISTHQSPLYRTGDLARWLPDGNIEFLGRIDQQVKIRGFRIELGEIENQLLRYNEIKEAVVLCKEDASREAPGDFGDKYLCAYIVGSRVDAAELREYLSRTLPDYMIPSYFVLIEKIPLTPKGKIDRKALPLPEVKGEGKYIEPGNELEESLVDIWSEVLGVEKDIISIDANFFTLGGHSLKATVLIAKIHKLLNVKIPLAEFFRFPTPKGLADYIKGVEADKYSAIMPVEKRGYYSLSSAQKRLYILQQMELGSTAYNMPEIIPLPKEFDVRELAACFRKLVQCHESLRTSFHMISEEPVQMIHDKAEFKIEYYDLATEDTEITEKRGEIQNSKFIIQNFFIRPFDLSQAPLLRIGLMKTPQEQYVLLVDMHHIISDGVSHEILEKDFMAFYKGEELSCLRIQYKDFSQWQNREKEKETVKQQEEYWLKEFEGEIPVLELSTDFMRLAVQSFAGAGVRFEIPEEERTALKGLSLEAGATLFMVLLGALNVLLSRLSSQEDIIVGTPIAGRRHADLEKIIGMFVNTLALRNYPCGGQTFREFLDDIKKRTLEAFENQDYQFEELVERAAVRRDASRNPLFDVMFVVENFDNNPAARVRNVKNVKNETVEQPAQTSSAVDYEDIMQIAKFDLLLNAMDTGRTLILWFQYCTKLFKEETIDRFTDYFKKIVSTIVKDPDKRLSRIEIISEEEKNRILYDFNNTKAAYPQGKTIHYLFEEQVERTPDHIAVVGMANVLDARHLAPLPVRHVSITYKELNEKSNRLAYLLMKKSVTPETNPIVGIMVEPSVEMIIGILGILKAGGAYLPIDPEYPEERINYMLKDCRAKVLLASPAAQAKAKEEFLDFIDISKQLPSSTVTSTSSKVTSADLAYVIYTSGSTGKPKGTLIQHRALNNLCHWHNNYYSVTHHDRGTKYAGFGFDASVWEIFPYLILGAAIYIVHEGIKSDIYQLNRFFEKNGITIAFLPTQMCEQFMTLPNKSLRILLTGGDKLRNYIKRDYRLVNNYGPTENTVVSSAFIMEGNPVNIPIGSPIYNTRLYVLNRHLQLQPVGASGELCISGCGLSIGYLNQPELTVEKFILFNHEAAKENEDNKHLTLYKTGDMGRWRDDGNLEFLGRIDQQVKIRGFRIELGEIENQLLKYDEIKEAVVLCKEDASPAASGESGDKYLCAYIVSDSELVISELREFLSKELPDYMIPSYFVLIEKIPLTPNGKIDRKALPLPEVKGEGKYIAPDNELEESLVNIWSEVLGIEKDIISSDANFFNLGGHSLKATVLIAKIHKLLNVKIPLAEFFRFPTPGGLAAYIKGAEADKYSAIMPVEKRDYYSLSSAQKRLYILQQMELESTAYNMPEIIPLPKEFDVKKLEALFKKLVQRHESLRTSFHMINEEPVQIIHDEVEFKIEYYDLATEDTEITEKRGEIQNSKFIIQNFFIRPFDLSQVPLLRIGLLKKPEEQYILLVDMHHIISDGVSHEILLKDFMAFYKGEELPSLRIQYKDFSQWQNREKEKETVKQQEEYWLKEFAGEITVLDIPTDFVRPVVQSFEGNLVGFEVSREETAALKQLSLDLGITLFMVLLGMVNILLSRLSSQEDIIVGTPIAGRRHADLEKIIGMFVNTLALRNYPHGEQTFGEFVTEVKRRTLEALENQEYQFEDLVEKVAVRRDTGRNPLFDVMFSLQNIYMSRSEQGKNETEEDDENFLQGSKFDLTLTAGESLHNLLFWLTYNTAIFERGTIERFIAYFKNIVSAVTTAADINIKLSQIEIMTRKEKKRILYNFNCKEVDYPRDKTIHRLFEEQTERTPNYIAVVYTAQNVIGHELQALTYCELNRRSGRLACRLLEKGCGQGSILALIAVSSPEMIVGILAVLKTGSCYLPIDPLNPGERIHYMLTDSKTKLLLTHPSQMNSVGFEGEMLNIEDENLYKGDVEEIPETPGSNHPVYMIYTSGTTGEPKGVLVKHENLVNYVNWFSTETRLTSEDKSALTSSFAFDLGYTSIYPALLKGAQLHVLPREHYLLPEDLLDYIYYQGISYLKITPSLFSPIVSSPRFLAETCRSLRLVVLGGEAVIPADVEKAYRVCTHLRIMNHYGPTELTIGCIAQFIDRKELDTYKIRPTIGKPIFNTKTYILGRHLNALPVGVAGELYIGGDGAASGYLNRPELTAERFIDFSLNTKHITPNTRLYRTGDLARWLPQGNIEFLGRTDHQIKIRGYRVELGEIENRLLNHEKVKESVVLMQDEKKGDRYLCAYIVPDSELVISELREFLLKELPDYMIPSYFVLIEKIPLTPNGKIDRKALPLPEVKGEGKYIEPGNELEESLVDIWSEVLGIEKDIVSIDANFFTLGGHSLKATVLISKVNKKFNVNIPLIELFKIPTIKSLAEYINTVETITSAKISDNNLVLLKPGKGSVNHLFMIHDGTGEVEGYMEFCKHLNAEFACWGIRADKPNDYAPRNLSIEDVARNYIEKIKKVQATGPYSITGWSMGGTIAFEMVRQLEQMNETIKFFAMVDVVAPARGLSKHINEFTLETEIDFVQRCLPYIEIREKLHQVTEICQIWSQVVDYLKENHFDMESLKKVITEHEALVIPNYKRLSAAELIEYLNVCRTFINARAFYMPSGKINSPIHYFAASQSKRIKKKKWRDYCRKSIKFYEVAGDHYSIFKMPEVVEFAKLFGSVLKNFFSKKEIP